MHEELRRLIQLQDLMLRAEETQEKIAAVPQEIGRLEKELLAFEAEVEGEKSALADQQKERRGLEMELMGVESRIQKYQAQLAEVKTNKEYQAMLHEIETCKEERGRLDEKILLDMERGDREAAGFHQHEERLQGRRRETEEAKRALREKLAGLEGEGRALEKEQEALRSSIPASYLDPFLRVARQRNGRALVAVRDERCDGCHVRVMPMLIQEVHRASGLIACDSCKRFLYVPEDIAAGAAAEADRPGSLPADGAAPGDPAPGGPAS